MPRDASGNYALPNAPVAGGDTVLASWANTTLNDLAAEMTDSLSRSGKGGFTDSVPFISGTVNSPGITWADEGNTGFYRAATNDMRATVAGADVARFTTAGFQTWDGTSWQSGAQSPYFQTVADHAELWGGATPEKRFATTDLGASIVGSVAELDNSAAAAATYFVNRNSAGGAQFRLNADGSFGLYQTAADGSTLEGPWLTGDRNGSTYLYANGVGKVSAVADGLDVDGYITVNQTNDNGLNLVRGGQTWDVYIENSDNTLRFVNQTDGEIAAYRQPNGSWFFYDSGNYIADTQVNSDNHNTSSWRIRDHGGTLRDVGFNNMPYVGATTQTVDEDDVGKFLARTGTANATFTLPSGSSGAVPPVGSIIMIGNLNTSGTCTINASGTLLWLSGSGVSETGPRTLAPYSVATCHKVTSTQWHIWGNGLS